MIKYFFSFENDSKLPNPGTKPVNMLISVLEIAYFATVKIKKIIKKNNNNNCITWVLTGWFQNPKLIGPSVICIKDFNYGSKTIGDLFIFLYYSSILI